MKHYSSCHTQFLLLFKQCVVMHWARFDSRLKLAQWFQIDTEFPKKLLVVPLVYLNCYHGQLCISTQPFLHHYAGEIYSAYDILSGKEVAIKVETHLSMFPQL